MSADLCHCGRPEVVNETLGYTRSMCDECDAARCDAYPGECPFERPDLVGLGL